MLPLNVKFMKIRKQHKHVNVMLDAKHNLNAYNEHNGMNTHDLIKSSDSEMS